jgi:hypothetical protein
VRVVLGLALVLALGCGRAFDLERLEARYPELTAHPHRLGDITPYLLPARGELVYFLCRWPDGAEIPVSLPADADDGERADIERVLRAWEAAGLGIRFGPPQAGRGIQMVFAEDEFPEGWGPRAASAVADCGLDPEVLADPGGDVLAAQLVSASIHLARTGIKLGRPVPYAREERIGALLHEMGHALGFQGHLQRGDGVMQASVEGVRKAGRSVMAGEPVEAAELQALYAVPTGSVLARFAVGPARTAAVDRLASLAPARGLAGPYAQVGDRVARILWRDALGAEYAATIWNLAEVLRSPGAVAVFPEPRAADLLRQ